tara:strand:- start:319 stop:492 length:174 start_codon:yes stop_codon:yes gene_type:complete
MRGSGVFGILVTIVSLGIAGLFIFEGINGRSIGPLLAIFGGIIMLSEQVMDLIGHGH